jgi:ribosomal protein S18 acetylase RimI-like enzyme/predicted nucleic acid-binding protein
VKKSITIEQDPKTLRKISPQILELSNSNKHENGFIPKSAFEQAIEKNKIIAAIFHDNETPILAGYLFYSGVFPYAKIQQIATKPAFRKSGIASKLLNFLISQLETNNFLYLKAEIAEDLPIALSFYKKNGFEETHSKAGGESRKRKILCHSRELDTNSLLKIFKKDENSGIKIKLKITPTTPVFSFDLNVLFDFVKNRKRSEHARLLFKNALEHKIRLVIAREFSEELKKTSLNQENDPILQLALQLPHLPKRGKEEINELASEIYKMVFLSPNTKGAGRQQSISDSKHLAHSILSNATAFITQDTSLIRNRQKILSSYGIDIATIEEIIDVIPEAHTDASQPISGEDFFQRRLKNDDFNNYIKEKNIPSTITKEFEDNSKNHQYSNAISHKNNIIGLSRVICDNFIGSPIKIFIHISEDYQNKDIIAEILLDQSIQNACENSPKIIWLAHIPGQTTLNELCSTRGFHRPPNSPFFTKISIGRPLTNLNWEKITNKIRRCTQLALPSQYPSEKKQINFSINKNTQGKINAEDIENFLSPTVFVWNKRNGVIIPIQKNYADELLGTGKQLRLLPFKEAAFRSVKGYINTPRASKNMKPGTPIIFYESKSKNGTGAAIATGRIVSSIVLPKNQLKDQHKKHLIVDNPEAFSSSSDILLTTFDNLMTFASPVSFRKLKELDAVGGANLRSATLISHEKLSSILNLGWPDE